MKATILDGSSRTQPLTREAARILATELSEAGAEVVSFPLARMEIASCLGCFSCWTRTPGICAIDDAARRIVPALVDSDLVAFVTPVTFGGYGSELKKALDRIIGIISPFFQRIAGETHHKKRYDTHAVLLGVGVVEIPQKGAERVFTTLVGRNALNMHARAHDACFVYPGQEPEAVARTLRTSLDRLEATS